MEPELACFRMLKCKNGGLAGTVDFLYDWLGLTFHPRPGVAKPNGWNEMDGSRFRSVIVRGDTNEDVFRGRFGVLDDDIKITVFVETTRIEELKLRIFF